MLFFKDEVSYILPKLKREMGLWQLFLLRQGCLQWLEKSSPTKIFFFRIKVGKKLSNSPISGKTGYKLTLKSKDQQSFGKPHYFRTTYCCLNVYRNPVRATSNEISCFEVDLRRSVFSFANIIKKKKKEGTKPQVQNWNWSKGSLAIVVINHPADHVGDVSLPVSLFSDWHYHVCYRTWWWCHTSCPSEFSC